MGGGLCALRGCQGRPPQGSDLRAKNPKKKKNPSPKTPQHKKSAVLDRCLLPSETVVVDGLM